MRAKDAKGSEAAAVQMPILRPLALKKAWSAALNVTVATSVPFL